MLTRDFGGLHVVHEGGLNACMTVCGDADANASGANQDACIRASVQNALTNLFRKVWIVHAVRGVSADVLDSVSCGLQMCYKGVFECEAPMVGTNGKAARKVGHGE